jgi:RimJ/RimL family protein N-acetyltransferase
MAWLPDDFAHPERLDLPTGHHVRPLRADDADIDYPAVMGSRDRLWAKYGEAWGWPPAHMTLEADRDDLAHHEEENAAHKTFAYAVLDEGETEIVGCVYIDPADDRSPEGSDAVSSWWVVDRYAGGSLERALDDAIPGWLADTWGFRSVHYFP